MSEEINPTYENADPEWVEWKDGVVRHWRGEEARVEMEKRQKKLQEELEKHTGQWVEVPFHTTDAQRQPK
jgi:hypothetical protein